MREAAMLTRITIAIVGALTILPLAPFEAKADAHGVGMGSSHFFDHHPAFDLWPGYGYYNVPSDASDDMAYSTPEAVGVAPTPPTIGCEHSEQTVKVPSANGGTTEVTILRC
jgi:hypothetical protein